MDADALIKEIVRCTAADYPEPDVRGWLAMSITLKPDEEVGVWWASDMNDVQIRALAESLIEWAEANDGSLPEGVSDVEG